MSGSGVVYGNGIYLHTSTFRSGAVSTTTVDPGAVLATFFLVVGTFCIFLCVVCHGRGGLCIVFVSRTFLVKTILEDVRPYRDGRIPIPSGPNKYLSR